MRYAEIFDCDVVNGRGVGVSLFVQGCDFKCYNCFNPKSWDFNGGLEWNNDSKKRFISLVNKPYIERVSILGGEPLHDKNLKDILDIMKYLYSTRCDKEIWIFTGFTMNEILNGDNKMRLEILSMCNVLVDGRYIDKLHDTTLAFRGSSNQRIIDVKKSLAEGEVILWQKQ